MSKMLQGGYTFFSTYQTCQRQFYFRYIMRWESVVKNQKMAWGSTIHSMLSQLTLNPNVNLVDLYDEVSKEEGLTDTDMINRGWKLINMWIEDFLPSDQCYRPALMDELIGIDVEGFNFLIKPDRVLYDTQSNEVRIIETKTTMYSIKVVLANVQLTDQVTAYIWGWNKRFHEKVKVVIPEILYSRGRVYEVKRGNPIYRTKAQLWRFEETLKSLIREITYKMQTDNPTDERWYPKKLSCTEGSNFKCDYVDICGNAFTNPDRVPPGFKRRERI